MSSMRIKTKLISALRRALVGLSLDELTVGLRVIGSAAPGWLTGCHSLTRATCRHSPAGGSYGVYPPAAAKVENISWICSRSIFGNSINTESVQTARIVIRRQGT